MASPSDSDEHKLNLPGEDQDLKTGLHSSEYDQDSEIKREEDMDEDPQVRSQGRGGPRLAASPPQTRRDGRIMRSSRKHPASSSPSPPPPPPQTTRKAGRPKGSKNKPKAAQAAPTAAPTDPTASNQQVAEAEKPVKPESEALKGLSRKELTYITYERPMMTLARALSYVGPDAPTFDAN